MKKHLFSALAIGLLGIAFLALLTLRTPAPRVLAPPAPVAAATPPAALPPAAPTRLIPLAPTAVPAPATITPPPDPRSTGSPLATELNAPEGPPAHDVQVLHEMLRQYLRALHNRQGLPIGNDTDLLRALTGHNPMKLVVLPSTHPAVGSDGRLRDRWGSPYFIHPRGAGAYEIRSAGPDRKLFTDDDLVANPAPTAPRSGESEPGGMPRREAPR